MPSMVRCPAGLHQYDTDRYSACPKCAPVEVNFDDVEPNDRKTRPLQRNNPSEGITTHPTVPARGTRDVDETTQILRTGGREPVTGWLVVIKGEGKGASLPIRHGVNSIGRDPSETLSLNFNSVGDAEIARKEQARLTFDPKGKLFYLQHGTGKNLTYLNDKPVLELAQLAAYDQITMGNTTLVFVPFCGNQFSWGNE
ncbi:MAG TPA: FHA domain-containing protein [Acidiferrobacteraceae bacterium]|nr:FHA domain-containing protein [Acidiferrobacteraceae bacterium]